MCIFFDYHEKFVKKLKDQTKFTLSTKPGFDNKCYIKSLCVLGEQNGRKQGLNTRILSPGINVYSIHVCHAKL